MSNLSAVRQKVRQILQDEFSAGIDLVWKDDEIDQCIEDIVIDISRKQPREVKFTVESDGTKKIDLTDITTLDLADLINVEKAEYEVDQDPAEFHNVERFGDELTLLIEPAPTSGDDIYLYCNLVHTLDETTSTLTRFQESFLVKGAAGQAAIAKSRKYIDTVNAGGQNVSTQLYNWGAGKLAEYKTLKVKRQRYIEYSED